MIKGKPNAFTLIGNPIAFAGLSTGFKIFFIAFVATTVPLLVTYGGLIGWTTTSWMGQVGEVRDELVLVNETLFIDLGLVNQTLSDKIDQLLDTDMGNVNQTLAELNQTLCDKIMLVNTSIMSIFESVNMSLYFDLNAALLEGDAALQAQINAINVGDLNVTLGTVLSDLNDTLSTKIMDGDMSLSSRIADALVSVNNVTGAPDMQGLLNLLLTSSGPTAGIHVDSDPMTHTIQLENTGIVTINAVSSLLVSRNLLITGVGMITINSYPMTSTIEIDGTALSTAYSNLQMQSNMQQMEISYLEGNVTNLQTQISNLQMVGDMMAQDLNGTVINFNMTVMELMSAVMTLQSTVVSLQSQIDSITGNNSAVPPGTISPFGGTVIPTGYLLCDGSQYSTTTYAELFTVIGTMYCPGSCSMGMFAVPDLRGKIPAGQGGTALSGTIGSTVGAETHTLSSAEMPTHSHSGSTNVFPDGNHAHEIYGSYSDGIGPSALRMGNTIDTTVFSTFGGIHSHTFTTNSAGSGQAHNNIQPSLIIKYIIKI